MLVFNDKIESLFSFESLLEDIQIFFYFYLSINELSNLASTSNTQNKAINAATFWKEKIKKEFDVSPEESQQTGLYYRQLLSENEDRHCLVTFYLHNFLTNYLLQIQENDLNKAAIGTFFLSIYIDDNPLPALLASINNLKSVILKKLQKSRPELLESFLKDFNQTKDNYYQLMNCLFRDPNQLDSQALIDNSESFIGFLVTMDAQYTLNLFFKRYKKNINYSDLFVMSCWHFRFDIAIKLLKYGLVDVNQIRPFDRDNDGDSTALFHNLHFLYHFLNSDNQNIASNPSLLQKVEHLTRLLLQQGANPDIICLPFAEEDRATFKTDRLSTRVLCNKVIELLDGENFKGLSEDDRNSIKNIYQIILTLPEKQEVDIEAIQEENNSFCSLI